MRARPRVVERRSARWALGIAAAVALAVAGLWLGLRVAGASTRATVLGDVRLQVEPAFRGEVDAYVPLADWGVRSRAFRAPLRVRAEPRSIDRSGVLVAAAGERRILERARGDIESAVASVLRRGVAFGVGGATLVGALAALVALAVGASRRASLVAMGLIVALAALIATGSVMAARTTFDAQALERPRFYARGTELLQLLDRAAKAEKTAARYRNKVHGSLQTFSTLLGAGGLGSSVTAAPGDGRRALLASDLHANRLVMEPLRALADTQDPVFFVGDFGHEGNEGEATLIAPAFARLGPRVIAVSGNHDSTRLMQALVAAGVTVLTSDGRLRRDGTSAGSPVIGVMGLRVAGFSDPLEWRGRDPADPRRVFALEQLPEPERARREAERSLVRWFDGLPSRPDIVLVHQNGLAQHLAATLHARGSQRGLTILTGHDHKQHVTRHGEVVVVDAGSVGAGGVLGIADERVAVGELRFGALEPALDLVDLIEVDPLGGAAQAERVIVSGHRCEAQADHCRLSRG